MEAKSPDSQMDGGVIIRAVMAFSGGMDSTALLIRLISEGYKISCLSYDYGQKHVIELEKGRSNISYLREKGYEVRHQVIDLKSAMSLFNSALTKKEIAIPEGHYEEEQMKQTVVPNRNAIFSSILYGHAISEYITYGDEIIIGLGVHSGDHEIYPDCRPEFYNALETAFRAGNWESEHISFHLPYVNEDKEGILRDALATTKKLDLDFDIVMRNTNTSYNPNSNGISSGKSGSDIERILAFHAIGRKDPIEYQDGWSKALEHALTVQEQWMDKNG